MFLFLLTKCLRMGCPGSNENWMLLCKLMSFLLSPQCEHRHAFGVLMRSLLVTKYCDLRIQCLAMDLFSISPVWSHPHIFCWAYSNLLLLFVLFSSLTS